MKYNIKNIDILYNYIFLVFCFMIPLSHLAKAVPNIILILLVLLFAFHSSKGNIKSIKKELSAILIFISILIINTLSFNRWEDFDMISKLFYIPIILALSSLIQNFKPYLLSFIAGAFLILNVSAFLLGLEILKNSEFELTNGEHVNTFLLGERPYLGFIYLISACFSFYLSTSSQKRAQRTAYIILGSIFIGFIFLIAARIAVLSVLISLVLALFYFVKKIKFNYSWLFLIPLFLVIVLSFSDNLTKRFYINDENISFFKAEPRYYIWSCAYTIMPENPKEFIFGRGYFQTENELTECYKEKDSFLDPEHKQWFIDSKFNTHNQFFDLFLSQGIIILIMSFYLFLYLVVNYKDNFFALSLVLSAFLFFSVENVLTRQIGCMLIAFVLCFVFKNKEKITNRLLAPREHSK